MSSFIAQTNRLNREGLKTIIGSGMSTLHRYFAP